MLIMLGATILTFLIGFIAINSVELPEFLLIFPFDTSVLMMTLIVFGFGFLFFGYTAPVVSFFAGVHLGWMYGLAGLSIQITASIISILLVSVSSIYMGTALLKDLIGKGNFKQSIKLSVITLVIALVISLIADFLVVT